MTRPWLDSFIRTAVYLYFAVGMTLLVSDGMVSALRYQADKRFPASFLLAVFLGLVGLLVFSSWYRFRRPINARKWIILCVVSSLGIIEFLFAPTRYGGGGA
jgi:H+/Cl- antiporter ClcA